MFILIKKLLLDYKNKINCDYCIGYGEITKTATGYLPSGIILQA